MADKKKSTADLRPDDPILSAGTASPAGDDAARVQVDPTDGPAAEDGEKPLEEIFTFQGVPLYKSIEVDEETGNLKGGVLTDEAREKMADAIGQFFANMTRDIPDIHKWMDRLQNLLKFIAATVYDDAVIDSLKEVGEEWRPIEAALNEIQALKPFIKEELKKPKYDGATLNELLNEYETYTDIMNMSPESMLYQAMEAARSAARESGYDINREQIVKIISTFDADSLDFQLDKANLFLWDLKETGGQVEFNFANNDDRDGGKVVPVYFSLTFDPDVKTSRKLTHFDRRLQGAIDTAMEKGQDVFTLTSLYHAIGNTGRPNKAQLNKINDSLNKQDGCKIFLDNFLETKVYDYPPFHYDDRALHFKRITAEVDGVVTDAAIKVLDRPALMTFARLRKQITTIPIEVLQSNVSQTDKHLRIEDYLLTRIARQKRPIADLVEHQQKKYSQKRQEKIKGMQTFTILLKTLYEHTGDEKKDSTTKKRTRKTAQDYLTHYKSEAANHWITDFQIEADRIIITLPIK